jgi:hypothetical protein
LSYAANAFGFDDTDDESASTGDIFRPIADSYTAAIFVVVPIDDIMAAIFNGPVAPIDGEGAFWIGFWSGVRLVMPYAISQEVSPVFLFVASL